MSTLPAFAERLSAVRARIDAAARRVGRDPQAVRLLGATKQVPPDRLREAVAAGLEDLGENRVQEARRKIDALDDLAPRPRWHLIGPLQSNKAGHAARLFDWVHSLDRPRIARELDRRAGDARRRLAVLIEVNVTGEASKHGVSEDGLGPMLETLAECPHLVLRGLMTIGPYAEDPEVARPAFRRLRELLEQERDRRTEWQLDQLSMGMSGDLEVAVEEGSTWVRVGTALFGARDGAPAREPRSA